MRNAITVACCKIQEKQPSEGEGVVNRSEVGFFFYNSIGLKRKKKTCVTAGFAFVHCLYMSVCGQCSEAFKTHRMASTSLSHGPVCWRRLEAVRGERGESFLCVDTMCGHSTPQQHLV